MEELQRFFQNTIAWLSWGIFIGLTADGYFDPD